MQQATTRHSFPRSVGGMLLTGALVLMLAIGAQLIVRKAVNGPASPAMAPALAAAAQPQNRTFADEAAYVPVVDEYTRAALSGDYLPLPIVVNPAPVRRPTTVNQVFADEAAYVPVVDEYTSAALGEDYLPVAPHAPAHRTILPSSRFFRDELAGAALPWGTFELRVSEQSGPETGPR